MLGGGASMTWSTIDWATYFGSGFFLLSLNWPKVPRSGTVFLCLVPLACLEPDLSKCRVLPFFSKNATISLKSTNRGTTYKKDTASPSAAPPRSR